MQILVLTGGGTAGLGSAAFLALLERELGPLHQRFDLIAGTSIGAVLASWIALGRKAELLAPTLHDAFQDIFAPNPAWQVWKGLLVPRYSARTVWGFLERQFGSLGVNDHVLRTRLLINALRIAPVVRPKFWKSWDPSDEYVTIRDALLASTAAPTYFAPHETPNGVFLDGGLSTNDLSMCALADAVRLGANLAQTSILTVRCSADREQSVEVARKSSTALGFASTYPRVSVLANQRLSEYQSHSLIGFNNHVVDLNIPGNLDDIGPGRMTDLADSALQAWVSHREQILERFQ